MSDAHGHDEKKSGTSTNPTVFYLKLFGYTSLFIVFAIYFYIFPDAATTFMYFLYGVEFLSFLLLAYLMHRLWMFMKEFAKTGGEIVKNYEDKIKHHHEHVVGNEQLEERYELAMKQLNSPNEEEWKTGLIELDSFIRLSLLDKGYVGGTTIDLLKDAKEKGHKHTQEAENIAHVRKLLKSQGVKFNYPKKNIDILLSVFDKFKKTLDPVDSHSHEPHH